MGFLHQPSNRNGCTFIPHLPDYAYGLRVEQNFSWIALIEDYPSCMTNMAIHVRNAGYVLILTSSPNDTHLGLTAEAKELDFPVVQVRDSYMRYLLEVSTFELNNPKQSIVSWIQLGEEQTQRLPTECYTATLASSGSEKGATQEACAICMEEFRHGDVMRVLPCNHHFHIKCIDEWLINHSDLCPLCKKQLPRGEAQQQQERRGC